MKNISETGHGINLSNFKLQIDHCIGFGGEYAPDNTDLLIANMNAQYDAGKALHETVITALQESKDPINQRELLFDGLSKLVTRSLGYVKSTKLDKAFKLDAKGLANKIRGKSKAVKVGADGLPDADQISNSHLSYVMRAENLKAYISLVGSTPLYATQVAGISLADLTALWTEMDEMNKNIGNIIAPVAHARIARNKALYNKANGILAISVACKEYVKGLYGASSPEYRMISGIRYRYLKIS
ncbi:MAG: hypothetical protein JNJ58_04815 [Chitinophagaceae bacterium]|nr:hypothetical protein [Chitinophagaceae bacterium]